MDCLQAPELVLGKPWQRTMPPVVLLLCGAQGSGKSTFASALIQGGSARWHRVNQDTVQHRALVAEELRPFHSGSG